jgi:DNA polymerase-3 subunit chi
MLEGMSEAQGATVVIHELSRKKKALDACRLAEALYKGGRRVVVWISDGGRAAMFDQYLWTFAPYAFVPHVLCRSGETCEEPVAVVSGTLRNPNGADALLVVDRLELIDGTAAFTEIHDLVAGMDEDAGKAEMWRAAGFAVRTIRGLGE